MSILLSTDTIDSLRQPQQPGPDVTPRPQLGAGGPPDAGTGLQGASYDEGYQPASGGYASQSAASPVSNPLSYENVDAASRAFSAQRLLGTSVLDQAGVDTSSLPWWASAGLRGATTPLSFMGGGGGLEGLATAAGAGAGQFIGAEGAQRMLPEDANPWLKGGVGLAGGLAGALVGGGVANAGYRGAGAFDSLANPAQMPPEASQFGRAPGTDSLFTAGPNGEVVGPTGNVREIRLGREPARGENVNRGLLWTNYGNAEQAHLIAEEQAAFGKQSIAGANPIGGGSGASAAEFARLTAQADAEKAATGAVSAETHDALMNLLGERIGATPAAEQGAAREAFYRDPANLGGGVPLTPEAQANLEALAPRAQQLNTITDSLANARTDALDKVISRNPAESPPPSVIPADRLAQIRANAQRIARGEQPPTAGGADVPPGEVPLTPDQQLQASGRAAAGDAQPFLTPEEEATNARLIDQQREAHYGGQAAGQVARTGAASPDALRQPDYVQTPDEIVRGNAAAYARSIGDTRPIDVTAPYEAPHAALLQRIADLQPLQEQQAKNVSALRSRQAGGLTGALEGGPGGRQGANLAMASMRGAAEQVAFQPLSDVLTEDGVNALYDTLRERVQSKAVTPFEYVAAKGALDNLMDGTRIPPPSASAALDKVFPGVSEALAKSPISKPPPPSALLDSVKHYLNPLNILDTWEGANNVKRTINTFFDFASPLRTSYLTVTHPGAWGTGWANTARILASKPMAEVEPAIRAVEDSILAHPTFQGIGVSSTADLYGPDSAFGMRALHENPYSGDLEGHAVNPIVNKVPVLNRSARMLSTWQRTAGPQILEDMISDGMANGRLPADFNVQNPAYREIAQSFGHATDQALGNGSLFQGDSQKQAANLFLNFGNWAAARMQMLGNGATGIAKNVANLAPGVNATLSPAEQESARMLTRLGAAVTSATYAINMANGIKPDDPRMYHNGIPVAVITPKMAAAMQSVGQMANNAHIPGVAGLLNFKPNTGVSLYLGLGTMVGQGIGIARAGYEGATGGSRFGGAAPTSVYDRLRGAVGNPFDPQSYGMSNEALYALRGYLAEVPSLAYDLGSGRTMGGETPSLKNEIPAPFMAENLITDRPQSTGSAVLNAVGGRAYEPSATQAARNGDFSGLQPNDQLKAINTQSWTGLATHPEVPKELQAVIGRYPSHYAWSVSFRENTAKAYEKNGYTTANAYALADKALAQQPIQKSYEALKNAYEGQWIQQNPALAEQVLEEDAGKDPSQRRLSVTNAQRDFIQQAVGAKR